jgi:cell division protein FtsB
MPMPSRSLAGLRLPFRRPAVDGARGPRGLSGRALVLCVVALILVLMLAAPVQRYLAHRSAVAAAERQQQQATLRVEDLKNQSAQWNDPAYVEQQARLRLQYVMPGDTVYQVVPQGSSGTLDDGSGSAPKPGTTVATKLPGDSWNQKLWGSVQAVDQAP